MEMDRTAGNDNQGKGFNVGCVQNNAANLFGIYSKLKIIVAEYLTSSHHLWLTNESEYNGSYSLSKTNFAGNQVFCGLHLQRTRKEGNK